MVAYFPHMPEGSLVYGKDTAAVLPTAVRAMAEVVRFELTHAGIKILCLTA